MVGAGGCSFGNQSGGASRLSISFGVYFFVLPGRVFGSGDSGGSDPACTGNAHAGSRAGTAGSAVDCTPPGAGACCDSVPLEKRHTSATVSAQTVVLIDIASSFVIHDS